MGGSDGRAAKPLSETGSQAPVLRFVKHTCGHEVGYPEVLPNGTQIKWVERGLTNLECPQCRRERRFISQSE